MKRIILFLVLLLLPVLSFGNVNLDLGTFTTAQNIRVPLPTIDSAGVEKVPDSGQVFIMYMQEATTNAYSYTSFWITDGADDVQVDSVNYRGNTRYYFVDAIADIDNDEGVGQYFGELVTWYHTGSAAISTSNFFTFKISATGYQNVNMAAADDNTIDAAAIADDAIDFATFAGTAPTAWWNEGKTGYTASTVSDKTGYSLTQTFPTNFADLAITSTTGYVSVGTNNDKTGYSISGTKTTLDALNDFNPSTQTVIARDTVSTGDTLAVKKDSLIYQGAAASASAIADAVFDEDTTGHGGATTFGYILQSQHPSNYASVDDIWDEPQAGHVTAGTFGAYLDAAISTRSSHAAADIWSVGTRTITGDTYTPDVNVVSLAASSVTAAAIADDAIDFATFAGTAPTTWWNEGKTAYSLTTQDWTTTSDLVGMDSTAIKTMINNNITSATLGDGWANVFADSTWERSTRTITGDTYTPDVNVVSLAAASITAATIADDAIDFATFAGTAPTAWWNEGKTGYTASTVSDKTGYSISGTKTTLDALNDFNPSTQTVIARDTVSTGDTLAVKKDSLIYQGDASGLSASDVWSYSTRALTDKTDFVLSTAAIDNILEYDTSLIATGIGQMLKDTSVYQGAASGLTAEQVWAHTKADSTISMITWLSIENGAVPGGLTISYPIGSKPKDSLVFFDSLGNRLAKVVFVAPTTNVLDTTHFTVP